MLLGYKLTNDDKLLYNNDLFSSNNPGQGDNKSFKLVIKHDPGLWVLEPGFDS